MNSEAFEAITSLKVVYCFTQSFKGFEIHNAFKELLISVKSSRFHDASHDFHSTA
jgi:hypothetical protein